MWFSKRSKLLRWYNREQTKLELETSIRLLGYVIAGLELSQGETDNFVQCAGRVVSLMHTQGVNEVRLNHQKNLVLKDDFLTTKDIE